MKRLPDWPMRLAELMDGALGQPFAWGQHDCATFAADCVLKLTGEDPLRDLRRRWSTPRGALRVIRRLGGFADAVTARLGEPVPPMLARRGDIVMMSDAAAANGVRLGGVLAVSFGDRCGAPGADRLALRPIGDALLCWRVGKEG